MIIVLVDFFKRGEEYIRHFRGFKRIFSPMFTEAAWGKIAPLPLRKVIFLFSEVFLEETYRNPRPGFSSIISFGDFDFRNWRTW